MLKHDRYWLAGLLEGEGQFGCYGFHQKPQCRISLVSTDKDVVLKARQLMGARSVRINRSCNRLGKKCQYRTDVYSSKAKNLMRLLLPLMSQRRRLQIRDALNVVG